MRLPGIAALVVIATVAAAGRLGAQDLRGFVAAGVVSDPNGQRFRGFGGGVLIDLGQPWVSAGGQGEMLVSWPYFAGRGAVFAQGNILRRGPLRPFVVGGMGFGESAGPMSGAGVDVRPGSRQIGVRAAVEDYLDHVAGFDCAAYGYSQASCDAYLRGGRAYTGHQVTFRIGVLFW
jgi:hypothetical protein